MRGKPGMKSPTDFIDPNAWREYVNRSVPPEDVSYVLAFGRTVLFARFYEVRNQTFPLRFCVELADIVPLQEPKRTHALEALNDRIFADMTRLLLAGTQSAPLGAEHLVPGARDKLLGDLLEYLANENPYFGLWADYSERARRGPVHLSWQEFVTNNFGPSTEDEMEFALLMGQLSNLLHQFHARQLALPPHHFSRIWFLHYLRGEERIAQTRALVQDLVEALSPCASA
jgi:hypothetical protein